MQPTTGLSNARDRLSGSAIIAMVGLLAILASCGDSTTSRSPSTLSPSSLSPSTTGPPEVQTPRADGPLFRPLPPAGGVPAPPAAVAQPVRLRIADLRIGAAPVIPVGVEANGELEVPPASEVGWYRFGSAPGEAGSSVLAAHIAYDGEDGVFRHLADVSPGALVDVELDDGTSRSYEITETRLLDKTDLPFDEVFAQSGSDRLVLITCGGRFNPSARSYEGNVVAYAIPVDNGA